MIELKRCPFCGDEVEIVPTGLFYWKYAIHHKSKTECIINPYAFSLPYEKEDGVRMWNTRADRKTEPQTDIHDLTDCDFCKDRNCKDCEGGKDEPQTDCQWK